MAESSVQSSSQRLERLLVEEAKHLHGVEDKVQQLRDELDWMQCFLGDAEANQRDDERIGRWVVQVKEYAYEAEDIVERYIVGVAPSSGHGLRNNLKRFSCILREVKALQKFGCEIDSLVNKISTLTLRLQTYGLQTTFAIRRKEGESSSNEFYRGWTLSHRENDIIGRETDIRQIVDWLVKNEARGRVVAICGVDGLGKTTVAKKVYHHEEIRRHFDAIVWARVPQQCQPTGILQEILGSLSTKSYKLIAQKTNDDLMKEIYEVQKEKKCFVVLEDVCSKDAWDSLKAAFAGADSGSALLFTARTKEVAVYVDYQASIHELNNLSEEESWVLLKKKLGGFPSYSSGNDARAMLKLGKEMVKCCQGLPLAVVLLGGLLATKESSEEWEIVRDSLHSYQARGKGDGPSAVLAICYQDLPYYLKPCLLHFANFPEEFEIPTHKLCRIWAAEGVVTLRKEAAMRRSLKDAAEQYLTGLVRRCMVQVGKRSLIGSIKTSYLHYVIRDFCVLKAAEENFLSTIIQGDTSEPSTSCSTVEERLHRLAIHLSKGTSSVLASKLEKYPHIRSLLFFQRSPLDEVNWEFLRNVCKSFPLLRILDLEDASIEDLPKELGNLIHLRFLCLKGTHARQLPSSAGNLRFLQTLDLRVSSTRGNFKVPDILWKMVQLRHLYLPQYDNESSEKLQLGDLHLLETLKNLHMGRLQVKDLLKLTNIVNLSVKSWVSEKESLNMLLECASIRSGCLKRLALRIHGNVINEEPMILSSFQSLNRLEILGRLSVALGSNMFPPKLLLLNLKCCYIEYDPMPILEMLPCLRSLCFDWDSFIGKQMICSAGGFARLMYLKLDNLPNLEELQVEKNAISNLLHLEIKQCNKLKMIPETLPRSSNVSSFKIN